MAFYARPSWRLARQVTSDVLVVAWGIGCWLVSRLLDGVIRGMAAPIRAVASTANGLRDNLGNAAGAAGKVPVVGNDLRKPLDDATGNVAGLSAQLLQQAHQIELTATVVGWVMFLLPLLLVVGFWLPSRLRFHRTTSAARHFADAAPDLDLFALRAMATLPMEQLARISPDPVGAWRAGDRAVIQQLAALELRRTGLSVPRGRGGASAVGTAELSQGDVRP